MGNETTKGLSVNAKTLILILLFVNIGFASKMLNKYYKMKETGYVREKAFHEQLEQRVMKAFGSMEELNKMVSDITRQKEDAEKLAESFREQGNQLRLANRKLEDAKVKLEEEKARLQREIWEREDSLSLAKKTLSSKDATIQELTERLKVGNGHDVWRDKYFAAVQELTERLEAIEKENAELKKLLEERQESPEIWEIPPQ